MKSNSIYKQVLNHSIQIILISALIIIVIFLQYNISNNSKSIDYSNTQALKNHGKNIDTVISSTMKSLKMLTQQKEFTEYCLNKENENYYMLHIQKILVSNLSLFDNLCYCTAIIKDSSDTVITDSVSLDFSDYLKKISISSDDYNKLLQELTKKNNGEFILLNSANANPEYLTIAAKYNTINNTNVVFMITYYKDSLSLKYDNSNFYVVSNSNIILEYNDNNSSKKEKDALLHYLSKTNVYKNYLSKFTAKQRNYYIFPSSVLLCNYVLATPVNKTNILLFFILNLILLALIILLIYKILGTKQMILPIKDIVEKLTPYHRESEDKNELSIIWEATNNIINLNDNLSKTIEQKDLDLKGNFITSLMLGILSNDEINAGTKEYNLDYLNKKIQVVLIGFYNYDLSDKNYVDCSVIKEYIDLSLSEFNKNEKAAEIFMFKSKYVIFAQDFSIYNLKKLLNKLITDLNEYYNERMIAAIGNESKDITTLKNSYSSALTLFDYRYFLSYKKVLTSLDISVANKTIYYPLDIEQTLINYTVSGNKKKVLYLLNDILKANAKTVVSDDKMFSDFIQLILSTINRCILLIEATTDELFGESYSIYLELKMCQNFSELTDKITYIFEIILDYCYHLANSEKLHLDEETFLLYIENNYNRDISLTDAAEYFGFTEQHTSKMIKKQTGCTFRKYLNNYRIEKAKSILSENSEISISDLSALVGFCSQNTFIRVFKETTGVSPGKFRNDDSE